MAETEQQAKSDSKKEVVREKQPEVGPGFGADFASLGLDISMVQRALEDPSSARPETILQLQRAVGNQSVLHLMGRSQAPRAAAPIYAIQAKLVVGAAYDNYELEADRVANQVMSIPDSASASVQRYAITPLAQRPALRRPTLHRLVQAKAEDSFETSNHFESRLSQSKGGGSPLPEPTRNFMEDRFGADFSQVRVHTGSEAVQLSREVSAQAFTHGSDIYFGAGKFNPESDSGKHLLAHELTHTIQQGGSGIQTQRLIQRKATIQDMLYSHLALPTSVSGIKSGLSGMGHGLKSATLGAAKMGIGMLGMEVMDLAAQMAGMGDAASYVRKATYFAGILKAAWDIVQRAYNMWEQIPPYFKTLIAYVTGSILHVVLNYRPWWLSRIPQLGESAIPGILITDSRVGKKTMGTTLSVLEDIHQQAAEAEKKPKKESGLDDHLEDDLEDPPSQVPISLPPKPSSLQKEESSGLKSNFKPELDDSSVESSELSSGPQQDEAPKGPMASLKLPYFTLDLLDMQTRKSNEEENEMGGLFMKAGVQFKLFGYDFGKAGKELGAEVTLPWGLNQIPQIKVLAEELKHPGFKTEYFSVAGIGVTGVQIDNDGLKQGTFVIDELNVANSVIVNNLSAEWKDQKLTFKGGQMVVDLFGFHAEGEGFELQLDEQGHFVKGGLAKASVGKTLNIEKVELTPEKGLSIDQARVKLPEYLDNAEVLFSEIAINKAGVRGKGEAKNLTLNFVRDKFFITNANFKGEINDEGWSIGADGKVNVNLGDSATGLDAGGLFDFTYTKKKDEGKLDGSIKEGRLNFALAGGIVDFKSNNISYLVATKTLKVDTATLKLHLNKIAGLESAGVVESAGKGFVLGPEGFDFESIHFGYKSEEGENKDIELFKGVKLSNIGASITKQGADYTVEGHTSLHVDITSPAKVKGDLENISVTFDKSGLKGGFTSFDLDTSWFRLITTGGKFTKEGFELDSAMLLLHTSSEAITIDQSDPQSYGMKSSSLSQLTSPIDVEPMFQVSKLSVKKGEGLKIKGGVKTNIKRIGVNMFGVQGYLDFVEKKGALNGAFSFPPKLPGWPVRVDVFYPVLPGLDVSGYVAAGGGGKVDLGLEAQLEKERAPVDGEEAWKVGFKGKAGLGANLYGEVGVGVYAGSSAIFAIGADLFLRIPLDVAAAGTIQGDLIYKPKAKANKFKPSEDFAINYDTRAALKAAVGLKLNAKFLYFFNKTLYTFTFKEWTLGEFLFKGGIGVDENGKLHVKESQKEWKFLGRGNKPNAPEMEHNLVELQEVEALASRAGLKIATAQKDKEEILSKGSVLSKRDNEKIGKLDLRVQEKRDKYTNRIIEQYVEAEEAAGKEIRKLQEELDELTRKKEKYQRGSQKPTEEAERQLLEKLQKLKEDERRSIEAKDELERLRKEKKNDKTYKYFAKLEEYQAKIDHKKAIKLSIALQQGEAHDFNKAEQSEKVTLAQKKIEAAREKAKVELDKQAKNKTSLKARLLSIKDFFKKIASIFAKKEKPVISEDEFVADLRQEKVSDLREGQKTEEMSESEKLALTTWEQSKKENQPQEELDD